jgi:hypothetical protein
VSPPSRLNNPETSNGIPSPGSTPPTRSSRVKAQAATQPAAVAQAKPISRRDRGLAVRATTRAALARQAAADHQSGISRSYGSFHVGACPVANQIRTAPYVAAQPGASRGAQVIQAGVLAVIVMAPASATGGPGRINRQGELAQPMW